MGLDVIPEILDLFSTLDGLRRVELEGLKLVWGLRTTHIKDGEDEGGADIKGTYTAKGVMLWSFHVKGTFAYKRAYRTVGTLENAKIKEIAELVAHAATTAHPKR